MIDEPVKRRGPRLSGTQRVWILNGVLAATGLILFLTLVRGFEAPKPPFPIPWWAVAGMFALAELNVVHLQFRRNAYSFSLSEIPLVVGLFFLPPPLILLAQVVGAGLALKLHRRQSPLKLAFNLGHQTLGSTIAILCLYLIAGPEAHGIGVMSWAAVFLATFLVALFADVMIGLAISLSEGELQFHTSLQVVGMAVVASVTNTSLALVVVEALWERPNEVILLLVPAGALFMAYRAYTSQRQERESLEFLYEAMRAFDQAPDLEGAIVGVLEHTQNMFRSEMAELTLFDWGTSKRVLRTTLGAGDGPALMQPVVLGRVEETWAAEPFLNHSMLYARPLEDDEAREYFAARGIKDAMVAQLVGEARILGVIVVGNRMGDVSTFDAGDLQLFETLASHVGVSLENGRLEKSLAQLSELQRQRARLLGKAVQASEDERTRLAADLHDGPIQRLTALGYGLERARLHASRGVSEVADDLLPSLQRQLSDEIQALRRLMSELRPPVLDERGLPAALTDYVREFKERAGVDCTVSAELDDRLAPMQETILYRMAQEALTNIWKHARAKRVDVSLRSRSGSAVLAVVDDGVGFDPEAAQEQGRDHFGLAVMRERVEFAGGTFEILSRPGRGTVIRGSLPVDQDPTMAEPSHSEEVWV